MQVVSGNFFLHSKTSFVGAFIEECLVPGMENAFTDNPNFPKYAWHQKTAGYRGEDL